jgi:hypothetical protein
MTAPSGKFIDKLIRGRLHPSLKELGFVRKGRTWNRDVNALKHVVNVQSGMFNSPRGGDFTINLGVFVPSVYRVVRGREPSFFANEIDCVVRLRLGALMEGGVLSSGASSGRKQDHWWAFGPSDTRYALSW